MPLYSSFNNNNRRFTKAESAAAFAKLKGLTPRKGNSSYSYNANPENYSGAANSYNNQGCQRSHYESWCYTDSQGISHRPIC